jgi:hypothetical protein
VTDLEWIFTAVLCIPFAFIILRVAGDIRAESRLNRKIAKTKRTEVIEGKEYTVITKSLPVVREKRTGQIGIALERGAQNDPTTINGQLALEPRWIRVQFVRESDGKAGRIEWRSYAKFEILGTVDVDYLTHRNGLFRSEELIRHPTDLAPQ